MDDRAAKQREGGASAREREADEREHAADARERAADERERTADSRDRGADEREQEADARETRYLEGLQEQAQIDREVRASARAIQEARADLDAPGG